MENILPYIPYNSSNKERAKENRSPMTRAERKMRFWILRDRPEGYKFIRQKMIDNFILDFYCSKLLLGIEIDGCSHIGREEYDRYREDKLRHIGIKIIRYTNDEVYDDVEGVLRDLLKQIKIRLKELETSLTLLCFLPYQGGTS